MTYIPGDDPDRTAYDEDDYSPEGIRARAEQLRRASKEQEEAESAAKKDWIRAGKVRRRRIWWQDHRHALIRTGIILAIAAVLLGAAYYVFITHEVRNIQVDGNTIYSDEQIINAVCTGRFGHNSLYLSMKYRNKSVENVPFVEKMTVNVLSPDSIRITVYEKALAGYVDYLGNYMYFTRDGTVVEASSEKVTGIPEVTGLQFDHIILHEKLPVKNQQIFQQILDITQLLNKYSLSVDRLYFDASDNISLFRGEVRCNLGKSDYIDEKISNLSHILPELEGKSGTIDMTGYTPEQQNISFAEKN